MSQFGLGKRILMGDQIENMELESDWTGVWLPLGATCAQLAGQVGETGALELFERNLIFFFFLTLPPGMRNLSSPSGSNQCLPPSPPAVEAAWSLNYWTTKEAPKKESALDRVAFLLFMESRAMQNRVGQTVMFKSFYPFLQEYF